jgi:hypothetical protein
MLTRPLPRPVNTYNVSNGEPRELLDVLTVMAREFGLPLRTKAVPWPLVELVARGLELRPPWERQGTAAHPLQRRRARLQPDPGRIRPARRTRLAAGGVHRRRHPPTCRMVAGTAAMSAVELHLLRVGACRHLECMAARGGRWSPVEFPALCGLIRHPERGWMLYDTGYAGHFFTATDTWPERLYRATLPVELPQDEVLRDPTGRLRPDPDRHRHGDRLALPRRPHRRPARLSQGPFHRPAGRHRPFRQAGRQALARHPGRPSARPVAGGLLQPRRRRRRQRRSATCPTGCPLRYRPRPVRRRQPDRRAPARPQPRPARPLSCPMPMAVRPSWWRMPAGRCRPCATAACRPSQPCSINAERRRYIETFRGLAGIARREAAAVAMLPSHCPSAGLAGVQACFLTPSSPPPTSPAPAGGWASATGRSWRPGRRNASARFLREVLPRAPYYRDLKAASLADLPTMDKAAMMGDFARPATPGA